MLSHLMGNLCDGVITYNIGILLFVKYYHRSHEPIVCIFKAEEKKNGLERSLA